MASFILAIWKHYFGKKMGKEMKGDEGWDWSPLLCVETQAVQS